MYSSSRMFWTSAHQHATGLFPLHISRRFGIRFWFAHETRARICSCDQLFKFATFPHTSVGDSCNPGPGWRGFTQDWIGGMLLKILRACTTGPQHCPPGPVKQLENNKHFIELTRNFSWSLPTTSLARLVYLKCACGYLVLALIRGCSK